MMENFENKSKIEDQESAPGFHFKDPSGTPAKEYKHEEKGLKIKEPPPPSKNGSRCSEGL